MINLAVKKSGLMLTFLMSEIYEFSKLSVDFIILDKR